jgi:hypothetical protein
LQNYIGFGEGSLMLWVECCEYETPNCSKLKKARCHTEPPHGGEVLRDGKGYACRRGLGDKAWHLGLRAHGSSASP